MIDMETARLFADAFAAWLIRKEFFTNFEDESEWYVHTAILLTVDEVKEKWGTDFMTEFYAFLEACQIIPVNVLPADLDDVRRIIEIMEVAPTMCGKRARRAFRRLMAKYKKEGRFKEPPPQTDVDDNEPIDDELEGDEE